MYILREANENDVSFIFSSWLKSYRNTQKYVNSDVYFKGQHDLIELILRTSNVVVICTEDDEESIIGYVVYRGNTLHYIYVKSVFRNLGMARQLLSVFDSGKPRQFSHFTPAIYFLFSDAIYNPYAYLEAI
jgi:hypothetical protein